MYGAASELLVQRFQEISVSIKTSSTLSYHESISSGLIVLISFPLSSYNVLGINIFIIHFEKLSLMPGGTIQILNFQEKFAISASIYLISYLL